MKFQTKLVARKKNPAAWILEGGTVLLFGSAIWTVRAGRQHTALPHIVFLISLGLVIIGVVLTRKKSRLYVEVSDADFIVTSLGISIGDRFYPMDQILYLDFFVEGYDRMPEPRFRFREALLNGMGNKVHFEAGGKRHTYRFYLEDKVSMRELGFLFREFYQNRLFFRERNKGGRTFLFQQVFSKKDLERAKQAEGYA